MKSTIALNANIQIDLAKLIDSRLLVQANSGGGKSWLLRRILEESHGKVQQIVIDLEGEFATLREKYDYLLCGKGGDVPAAPKTAALLARKILELNVSAIIDLYELPHHERKHFVRLFLESMINAPKELWHSCIVVIDEAHVFVPEKGESEAAEAVIDLATRGRKRGYCAVLATQRLSKLHKDAAAECNNKLIGRTGLDIDMKRAAEELGFTSKEQYLSLRKLEPGEFYAYGPAISSEVVKLTIGEVKTTHPKAGSRNLVKSVPPSATITAALKKLIDLPQEAEKELKTTTELKAEIARLRRELSLTSKTQARAAPVRVERIEVPTVGKRALEGLKASESNMRKMAKGMRESAEVVETAVAKLSVELARVVSPPPKKVDVMAKVIERAAINSAERYDRDVMLSGPEQRILDAIAWMESIGVMEPEQTAVAFLAGYTFGGGGFNNPKGSLRSKGLLEYRGDRIALTEGGRGLAHSPDVTLTTEELHKKVLDRLPGPERKLLAVLLERNGEEITNEELAERSGYTFGSGGFNNPRGRLRSLGLIEYVPGGKVKARSLLFF